MMPGEPFFLGDTPPEQRPTHSRSLLTPGPLPPLSTVGLDMLRLAVGEGLRYALYHLGMPAPAAPPVEIIRLRLYLDARELRTLLTPVPGGAAVLAALLEPGGTAWLPATDRLLAAALSFHKVRLLRFRLPAGRPPMPRSGESPGELWHRFRAELGRRLLRTNDALLADLVSAADRRAARARGEEVPPALSRAAWRLRCGRPVDLRSFGPPDLLAPSWAEEPERAEAARYALARHPLPGHDRYRGRFREAYRASLVHLAPLWHAYARQAADRGLIGAPDDACFLSLDEATRLAAPEATADLKEIIRENREEHESLRSAGEPLDVLGERQELGPPGGDRPEWDWAPLLPLP
jgi:hypothetical protein